MKAIVVDDSTVIRRLIAGFLYAPGFDLVLEGKNGVEALQHLAGDDIADLLVLDVNMPAMSGWQLVHLLDGSRPHRSVEVGEPHGVTGQAS